MGNTAVLIGMCGIAFIVCELFVYSNMIKKNRMEILPVCIVIIATVVNLNVIILIRITITITIRSEEKRRRKI